MVSVNISGVIEFFGGKVICNVLGCEAEASFKWFFQNTERQPLTEIKGDNSIPYMGDGRYFCNVTCGEGTVTVSAWAGSSVTATNRVEYQNSPSDNNTPSASIERKWDFSKLGDNKELKDKIKELYSQKSWKELAKIHNQFGLSDTTVCCDMSYVEKGFSEYMELLERGDAKGEKRAKKQKK